MLHIRSLNIEIQADNDNMEDMIKELSEREEFLCTGNACGADATLI